MTTETEIGTITVAALPPLKAALAGGQFAGVITLADGTHHAVVLLEDRPAKRLTWVKAGEWAKKAGGQLPSRTIWMLLFATCRELIAPSWYWSDEPDGESDAWYCYVVSGSIGSIYRSSEGGAVAVRLIPLTA